MLVCWVQFSTPGLFKVPAAPSWPTTPLMVICCAHRCAPPVTGARLVSGPAPTFARSMLVYLITAARTFTRNASSSASDGVDVGVVVGVDVGVVVGVEVGVVVPALEADHAAALAAFVADLTANLRIRDFAFAFADDTAWRFATALLPAVRSRTVAAQPPSARATDRVAAFGFEDPLGHASTVTRTVADVVPVTRTRASASNRPRTRETRTISTRRRSTRADAVRTSFDTTPATHPRALTAASARSPAARLGVAATTKTHRRVNTTLRRAHANPDMPQPPSCWNLGSRTPQLARSLPDRSEPVDNRPERDLVEMVRLTCDVGADGHW